MKRGLTFSLLIAAVTLLTIAGYGQTVIDTLPFFINKPGVYILRSDLSFSGGEVLAAIHVQASDVTIDLKGYALRGNDSRFYAIATFAGNSVVIRNGSISGFNSGIMADLDSGLIVEDMHIVASRNYGINLANCTNASIRNCSVAQPRSQFPTARVQQQAIHLSNGIGNWVVGTTVVGLGSEPRRFPVGIGSERSRGNYFENDYVVSCDTGVSLGPSDKYRSITTTDCAIGIVGGTDVDNASK